MAHFAELDDNNIVLRVTVVNNEDCLDENGAESELVGANFCANLLGGKWLQTSYNHKFRKQYAGEGYFYDNANDVFVKPQPFPSWTLDENFDWQPPTPRPEGAEWVWSEEEQVWITP